MAEDVKALIAQIRGYFAGGTPMGEEERLLWKAAEALHAATVAPAVDREALVNLISSETGRGRDIALDVVDMAVASGLFRDVRDVQAEAEKRGAEAMRERILRFADDDGLIDQNLVASITAQAIREARNG